MLDIVVLIGCALCGFAVGKYLEKRIRNQNVFYTDLSKYVELLALNIESKQTPLNVFNDEFAQTSSTVFAEYLLQNKLRIKISSQQKSNLDSFFFSLGSLGSQELSKHVLYYRGVFANNAKDIADKSAKASIFPRLGILLGVMVGILLI